jgi:DNA-binding beta-propeller fold protein YncE
MSRRHHATWLGALALLSSLTVGALGAGGALGAAHARAEPDDYTLFEVGQVRPLALDGRAKFLYAVNTPDDRLEVYALDGARPVSRGSVAVGLRPVAVALRNDREAWVVNHLSDSISIVDISTPEAPRVVRTLLVGDEPRDIVFGGPRFDRAFVTTAHRGQNAPYDPQLATPGVPRADVWVYDANDLGRSVGGTPLTIVQLFSDTPRALAVSEDGTRVFAAAFASGNGTTVISEGVSAPLNETNTHGEPQPHTSIIAKFESGFWTDAAGRDVSHLVNFSLPDYDVFTIDAAAKMPRKLAGPGATFSGVGTTLFNMVVNPVTKAVYVTNTEANNFTRFEGPGLSPGRNTTVRGNIAQSRITVIKNGQVKPVHLNKHIDYGQCCAPPGSAEAQKSLAAPRGLALTRDGTTLYVAAHDSNKIGVFDTRQLESDSFIPDAHAQITLRGGGPSGLVLDERRRRLYALTRFDNAIAVVDTAARKQVATVAMHTPEPPSVVQGRPFLYDATLSSSHGDASCASCHIDGNVDHLAWDLGDPTALLPDMPGTAGGLSAAFAPNGTSAFAFALPLCSENVPNVRCTPDIQRRFNSLKGPMTTQALRGMDNHGSMHWRGDRTAGTPSDPGAQPDTGMFDESAAFNAFNEAFPGLLGRSAELPDESMRAFTRFMLQSTMPPNPVRNLDNSLTPQQARGRALYFGGSDGKRLTDAVRTCNGCHVLDPTGNAQYGVARPGFFGGDGRFSFENLSQMFKVPQLRNLYEKVGMFGSSGDTSKPFAQNALTVLSFGSFEGEQVRGFGFQNDGSAATVFDFLSGNVFINFGPLSQAFGANNPGGFAPYVPPGSFPSDPSQLPPGLEFLALLNDPFFQTTTGVSERRELEAFMLAFDNNLLPIVGQQVTLGRASGPDALARLDLLEAQAAVVAPQRACDLIATGRVDGRELGYLYDPATHSFASSCGERALPEATLRAGALRGKGPLTFTCAPPGEGRRRAFDRDRDGYADTLELDAGSDPADPASIPRRRGEH